MVMATKGMKTGEQELEVAKQERLLRTGQQGVDLVEPSE